MPLTTVDTGIITDASVTSVKMGVGAALGNLGASAITSNELSSACVTPAKLSQPFTLATVQATTSGTLKDFTIPSWVKRVRLMLNGVSLSGTALIRFQLGVSGGIVSTGYTGAGSVIAATVATVNQTAGVDIYNSTPAAADVYTGAIDWSLMDATNNIWIAHGVFAQTSSARTFTSSGLIALSGALTTARLTTSNGTDTFDLGSVNVFYD